MRVSTPGILACLLSLAALGLLSLSASALPTSDDSPLILPLVRPIVSTAKHGIELLSEVSQLEIGRLMNAKDGEKSTWLSKWLSMGGEGMVTVSFDGINFTLPHRPAAFPSHLSRQNSLPIQGILKSYLSLPPPHSTASVIERPDPALACHPPAFPPIRFTQPSKPYLFVLIERGACDFATKVKNAQERGAAGVIVGDSVGRIGESETEGRTREQLITMFSTEDTETIFIPSVFVSRASYLVLRDLLVNDTDSGRPEGTGLWVEIGEGKDEGGALSSLLSFALLMPSLFLLATIAIHRIRVARQREADRAPPLVVLSLPERIWTPDIVWEKEDSDSDSVKSAEAAPQTESPVASSPRLSALSPISPSQITSPPAVVVEGDPLINRPQTPVPVPSTSHLLPDRSVHGVKASKKSRTKCAGARRQYFSKDECAICMDSFVKGDVVRILPCGHVFHKDECDEWLMKWRKLCPTCRADVTLPPNTSIPPSTTLTPVTLVPVLLDPLAPTPAIIPTRPSMITRIGDLLASTRQTLFSRRIRLNGAEEIGERTPLVNTPRSTVRPIERNDGES